jgi:predicted nucleic acid-binding protein
MILIDTSIWIEFFKSNPDFAGELELLLEGKQVITIEPVFAELLYGSRSEKETGIISSYWNVLPQIKFNDKSFIEAAKFANKNNYHHLGIGLIDAVLIKACIENKCLIWTLDKKILHNMDKQFLHKSQA